MRWIASLFFLTVTASAQVDVPEGTRIRVRLKQPYTLPPATAGDAVIPVAEPVIVSGAVVVERDAPVTVRPGARRSELIAQRVQAVDGTWLDLRPTPAPLTGPGLDLFTTRLARVAARRSLPHEAVDFEQQRLVRMGLWVLDAQRSWFAVIFDSGASVVSLAGVVLIAIGAIYRLVNAEQEGA